MEKCSNDSLRGASARGSRTRTLHQKREGMRHPGSAESLRGSHTPNKIYFIDSLGRQKNSAMIEPSVTAIAIAAQLNKPTYITSSCSPGVS